MLTGFLASRPGRLVSCALLAAVSAGSIVAAAPAAMAAPGGPARTAQAAAAGPGKSAGHQLGKDLEAAWQITKGAGTTVAIISGGVDPTASGLSGVVTTGRSFGNVAHSSKVDGTVEAAAIAGRGPSAANFIGTLGLAPAAHILSVAIPDSAGEGTWQDDVAQAIRYAAGRGAQVICVLSVGADSNSALDSAVQYALSKNAVVLAAEFGSTDGSTIPAMIPGVFGAGSAVYPGLPPPDKSERFPSDDSILVTAPANTLVVNGPGGSFSLYDLFNDGSSMAWLAATVAMIKAVYPDLAPSLVARAIATSARNHPAGGYTTKLGFGLLNPVGALHAAAALTKLPATAAPGQSVVAPAARFVPGPPPLAINAVHHSRAKLAGLGASMLVGLLLLITALVLSLRRRRRPGQPPAVPVFAAAVPATAIFAAEAPAAPAWAAPPGVTAPVGPAAEWSLPVTDSSSSEEPSSPGSPPQAE